jgi:hypothetical protein
MIASFTLLRIVVLLKRLVAAQERIATAAELTVGIRRPTRAKVSEISVATVADFERADKDRREREANGL